MSCKGKRRQGWPLCTVPDLVMDSCIAMRRLRFFIASFHQVDPGMDPESLGKRGPCNPYMLVPFHLFPVVFLGGHVPFCDAAGPQNVHGRGRGRAWDSCGAEKPLPSAPPATLFGLKGARTIRGAPGGAAPFGHDLMELEAADW